MSEIRTNIFSHSTVKLPVSTGTLMVAEPFLREQYFRHGVVSLVDCSERQSAMGVVMNNCTALLLSDIIPDISVDTPVPVFCGGPMSQDRLFFIHTLGSDIVPGAISYARGLYLGGDMDSVLDYVRSGYPVNGVLRFFLGYCGWDAGQLDTELDDDVWAVVPPERCPSPETLLSIHGDRLWHSVVRKMGKHYRTWNLHPLSCNVN